MQRIFSAEGPWPTPWMDRVLPVAAALANRHPERTVFTRFIPPERPDQMPGMWRRYYTRWRMATRECLDLRLLELMPPLAAFCPPATVIDKTRYFRPRPTQAGRAFTGARGGRADRLGI
jgi:nicotinamidase-related amidase